MDGEWRVLRMMCTSAGCTECFFGLTKDTTRSLATNRMYKISLVPLGGIKISAALLRNPGSSFKQCNEDVAIARSNSILPVISQGPRSSFVRTSYVAEHQ